MRLYKHIVRSASASAIIPSGSQTTRITAAVMICKAIVACFGAPTVSGEAIQAIVKNIVWDDISHNFNLALVETISAVGILGTIILHGAPVVLVSGAVNVPLAVPTTTRLMLMLACDVILILTKAFKNCTDKCLGHPLKQDIEQAAREYRSVSKQVHKRIKRLIPLYNPVKSFQAEKVKIGFEKVIEEYRDIFVEGVTSKPIPTDSDSDSESTYSDATTSVSEIKEVL